MKECQHCKKCYTDDVNVCPTDGMPTLHTLSGEPVLEGKYHLEKRLGQGGMGVVYCAKHAYLKTQHAIKVILPDLVGNDPQLVTRFRQEALAAAAIRHHNVVGTTDYGVVNGKMPFLVMEYVEGESLHDLLQREGRLSPEKALELISAICAGIGAAHHQGIVHRDLKPLNIMICKDKPSLSDAVKILDFGLAKIKSGELLGSFIQAQTTGLMGSPYYMAPEQWSDEEPDARSDIYSLGVMLFQMITGDVPFKGSSIPAIMKKHLYDPPPTFAEMGVNLSPQIELAVRHTLEKDPKKRTATVEIMVGELRNAVGLPTTSSMSNASVSVSSLSVLTNPPKAKVFINNIAVGQSKPDGLLFLEGIQSGNHHLRVSHDGFEDWEDEVFCDGKPRQVVAELRASKKDEFAIPKPEILNSLNIQTPPPQNIQPNFAQTQPAQNEFNQTKPQTWKSSTPEVFVESVEKKKSAFSPLLLGIIGIAGLLILVIGGFTGAYMLGFIGSGKNVGGNNTSPTPSVSPSLTNIPKAEMVKIPGGTFKMGRNDGDVKERPEHSVTVKDFSMDKNEVTNEEYLAFVTEANYPAPNHWVNGKPVQGTERFPVRFVSFDDAENFAKWRSKRDGLTYRLPTEEEWEYAARNGAKNNLYPWGDKFEDANTVMNIPDSEPAIVGSKPNGRNMWGVVDLIGNVWEWTSTEIAPYPGSGAEVQKSAEKRIVVRGGSAHENPARLNITSTFRADVSFKQKEKTLGFRLARSE
ncbi:MAG TPA: SUMF1/EgtB/PvdO family nonheme iron enzyme [Pyrinomonadaceae bacterium]|nr:SUMF1/EgtB/PvdO family nonheme iron enzyme [Pyrinomonadaceae bacterium]